MLDSDQTTARGSAPGFRHAWAFWLGVAMVTGGVLLHLPMFLSAKSDGYMLRGMPMDNWMLFGMGLMVVGYVLVIYGLAPRLSRGKKADQGTELEFEALDESRLSGAHIKLMLVLTLAVAVDTQKPFTFTFILPGVANEYDLRSPSHPAPGHWPVALFPFVAIVGTVIGSLIWGRLGDSIGRRAAILLAATLFIGTAMCSAMPAFHWNLVACLLMGMSAGGLLPIAYSLLAEAMPARRRGGAVVLVAGIGTALGFLLASWSAHWLIPTFGWRIMWWFGIPTGLALILLNRYIPESPRYLLQNGRTDEAHEVMRTFGIRVSDQPSDRSPGGAISVKPGFASVFRKPFAAITPVLMLYGLAWGLVNFGFLVWLPVFVANNGVSAGHVTAILAKAALFAIPGSVLVAWLYGRWSSRGTLILAAALEAAALGIFAGDSSAVVHSSVLFTALMVLLLVSMWATISALSPYAAEIYPTAIRSSGSGVVAGATKLGGVIALGIAVLSWAPPSAAGAALIAAVTAGAAALLLVFTGIETRGRRLEEIAESEASTVTAERPKRTRALRIGGATYPVVLPSWKDPRLRLSTTFVFLYVLGFVEFHFRLSFPQIATAILTCALIEVVVTFRQKRAIIWPASAMLTGNGIAFIMRIPGTGYGEWWSFNGVWIYAAVAAVAMASKYFVKFRGRHIFNPSNVALVLAFVILGSNRAEPLAFWWGPLSPALVIVLLVIVAGALVVLSQVGMLQVSVLFWVTFASSLGILALSGHAFSANWHLGPVADGYFWKVLVTSPEVFIFLSFMITDPKTAPETRRSRRIYAIAIGLLGALLIAPMQTEFWAKVALLGTLTIVCAARPLIILSKEAIARRELGTGRRPAPLRHRRSALGVLAATGAAAFAALIVAAGSPARSVATVSGSTLDSGVSLEIKHTIGVVSITPQMGKQIAGDAVADLALVETALGRRDPAQAAGGAGGAYLTGLKTQIAKAAGGPIVVDSYRVSSVALQLQQAVGQAPPTVVATLTGQVTPLTYQPASPTPQSGTATSFEHDFDLALAGGRFLIIGDGGAAPAATAPGAKLGNANLSKGVGAFSQLSLVDVAPKLGLDFRQGAFRYSMAYDSQAMMGGGVCWLDYNNDGWLDLFAVNSYADVDMPVWERHGGLPQSALFENVHGRFVNVSSSTHAGIRVKGTGCVAADLNGDGHTDLVVTTATGVDVLWNKGNGAFTAQALAAPYGWYAGAAVADVNGDGRPDIFVAGYTNMAAPITTSFAGFPTNYEGERDLLFVNEGNGPDGRTRFKEAGVKAGLESSHFRHGLGAIFTDVNGDGRPDLYVANDEDPNDLYINEPGGPLGFHFVDEAKSYGVDDHNAGMGVAEADFNGDGRPDMFITNSRGQPHAAYESEILKNGETVYRSVKARFAKVLDRKATVGWGDAFVDFGNSGDLDLILANGAIPVTNLKRDTEPIQVLQGLGGGKFTNAGGIIDAKGLPKIIGRGLAPADFDNNGRTGIAINTIGGPLVLLEDTGPVGHWLEVSLKGFQAGAVLTATLPNGRRMVQELHAGSSYLSSADPRAHFGLGNETKISRLTIRWPDGRVSHLANLAADRIVTVAPPRP
jgi:MFS transporter, putative metabolite:H+ symporter